MLAIGDEPHFLYELFISKPAVKNPERTIKVQRQGSLLSFVASHVLIDVATVIAMTLIMIGSVLVVFFKVQ